MDLNFIVLLIGIIILILSYLFEAWGHYEFEPFAYKYGIIIYKATLKIKVKTFAGLEGNFYRRDNINYKFISNNFCIARLGSKDIPFFMYIKPIPSFSYRIKIKNDKYVISIKISFFYLIIIGFLLYYFFKDINNQNIEFNNLFPLIFYLSLFIFFIIFSLIKLDDVERNFKEIIEEKI
jgi:hypothetical protein